MNDNVFGRAERKLLVQVTDDGPLFTAAAMALFTGAPEAEIAAEIAGQGIASMDALPEEWVKAGRRRASEAAAVTGTRDGLTALRYWAAQEHNVELFADGLGLYTPSEGAG